ncbi:transaldolase [Candidatus Microgenomates bacterium]|nr:transaldolase [Candidatus Microgenomates bacterium]
MRPANLTTKIFLDSGDPDETRRAVDLLGFLDGQTTNPTLISKNPEAKARLAAGQKFTKDEIYGFYQKVVKEISPYIHGSVSIEVYSDTATTTEEMFAQAQDMFTWIPNAHIKLPLTKAGLTAAESLVKAGIRVNITLCFSQAQAAAVYAATRGAHPGDVFVSPFIGRLDDLGLNGLDLISNIQTMYRESNHHVSVLAASIRTLDHLYYCLSQKVDLVTVPFSILDQWQEDGMRIPGPDYRFDPHGLNAIPYDPLDLHKSWKTYMIDHELTTKGIEQFSADWNSLVISS